jgi:hypothetical protein
MTTTKAQSKSQEFEALCAAWDERIHSADWARNETWRARDGLVMFLVDNRELVARALRRDEAIESPTYEVAVAIGQAVESPCEHPGWDDRGFAALTAFREAVT